jgi:hypothetical protein
MNEKYKTKEAKAEQGTGHYPLRVYQLKKVDSAGKSILTNMQAIACQLNILWVNL